MEKYQPGHVKSEKVSFGKQTRLCPRDLWLRRLVWIERIIKTMENDRKAFQRS